MVNGAIREFGYAPYMSELRGHQLSTLTAVLCFALYIGWLTARFPLGSARRAAIVGLVWLAMTMAFEFLFGRYAAGRSWAELWRNYDLTAGRLWPLLLVWVAAAPYVFHRFRERRAR